MSSLTVRKPGLLTTLQDLGRFGFGRFGVPRSGAMDTLALRLANRLLGNSDNAPALEITGVGPEIEFHQPTQFALAGANLTPHLDDRSLALWQSHQANEGDVLRFGARRQGARCYLAVAGGILAPPVMGSVATDLDSGIGGIDGKALRAGQVLQVGEAAWGPARKVRLDFFYQYANPFELRFVAEAEPFFTTAVMAEFKSCRYRVSEQSDRMGYRLRGPSISGNVTGDMISEAIPPGTIQVPPSGEPILLMVDGQNVAGGGYPRLGYVIRADLPKAAQLWVGHRIRFCEVTLEEAEALFQEQEAMLENAIRHE